MRPFYEKLPHKPNTSFDVIEFNEDRHNFPLHFHPEYELCFYVKSFYGQMLIGDNLLDINDGEVLLVGPNIPHACINNHKQPQSVFDHGIVILFNNDSFGPHFFDQPEMKDIKNLLHRSQHGLLFDGSNLPISVRQFLDTYRKDKFASVLEILNILHILSEHVDYTKPIVAQGFVPFQDEETCDRIDKIYQYISQNFNKNIELSDISDHIHMSNSALCRYFKRKTGKKLFDVISEIRLGQAKKRLLYQTDLNISQIAYECGFHNLSTFNKRFREAFHMTPKKFKQQLSNSI